MTEFGDTVDRHDIDRFAAQASSWWDPRGSFRPLHQINPARLDFIRRELLAHFRRDPRSLSPFAGLSLADIGCGGGLIAEPMARLGFAVTGIDAGAEAIGVARAHAEASGLAIDYRVADVEMLAAAGERFDAVLALEIVEHVADRDRLSGGARRAGQARRDLYRRDAEPHGARLRAGDRRRRIRARLAAARHA